MARFQADEPNGVAVQQLEVLVRTAVFKSANLLVGWLLQRAADQIDDAYQPKPGQHYKGRFGTQIEGMFGSFPLERDYYYHAGKRQGHYPADAALGLESGHTPALTRLMSLEGADETSYQKAEQHLAETGGIHVGARQIQRRVQRVGEAAQQWQEREAKPGGSAVPIMYVSADGTGVPMRKEELVGRAGKQLDGSAKTRMAYLGCALGQKTAQRQSRTIDYSGPQGVRWQASSRGSGKGVGLLCQQRRSYAVWHLSPQGLLHRLRRDRSGLQNRDRRPLQAIGNVLRTTRRPKRPGSSLHSQ